MPQFAANLSYLYPEHPFLDRFAAAAKDGFAAVEAQFPYAHAPTELAARLAAYGLRQVLINAPLGKGDASKRGLACLPGHEAEFRTSIETALAYAVAIDCPRIHVVAGIAPPDIERPRLQGCYETNLAWAAEQAHKAGCDILIEPINRRDIPGFFLNRQDHAHATVQSVGAPNLKVQMDLYHCQIVEGDVAEKIRKHLPTGRVGHLQIAGVPDRHEPDIGELHHPYLFDVIDEVSANTGWSGFIGCEYRPRLGLDAPDGTSAGLGWLHAANRRASANLQARNLGI